MIICTLNGGLGNQLFQYALGRRLALERNVALKLDLSWFQSQTVRRYMLDRFQINAEIATSQEIALLMRSDWNGFLARIYRVYQAHLPYYRRNIIREIDLPFDPLILKVKPNSMLVGYWQSEKYFKTIEGVLRREFRLKKAPSSKCIGIIERVQSVNSVSVHVRRGDYVDNPRMNRVHGICSIDYYKKAAEYFNRHVHDAIFFVFSDDLSWAKTNLAFLSPMEVVEVDSYTRDEEELILMSRCRHHIIANSSYSWWGAWLGNHSGKKVIAPNEWFNDKSKDTRDLIPDTWIRL